MARFTLALLLLISLTGCTWFPQESAESEAAEENPLPSVDVAVAEVDTLSRTTEYVGTTRPIQEVSLRSQVEGRLLSLTVEVGDRVTQGQAIGQLDDRLLAASVTEAQAQLAALQSELARAQSQLNNAKIAVQRARIQLAQLQNDARRFSELAAVGGISEQQAESARTAAQVAEQEVLAALEQIRLEEQAVAAAVGRVAAQRAVLTQQQQRQAFSQLTSPIAGVILAKSSEPGDLIDPGQEVLRLGDLSSLKVIVPISELELTNIRLGQTASITLDAFSDRRFQGTVTNISPVADEQSRQIPLELTLPNPNGDIGSGLLARASFQSRAQPRVVIPQEAIQGRQQNNPHVFVVDNISDNRQAQVEKRPIQVGTRLENRIEVLSGLQVGDRFVLNSSKKLEDGATVRLSILSELEEDRVPQ